MKTFHPHPAASLRSVVGTAKRALVPALALALWILWTSPARALSKDIALSFFDNYRRLSDTMDPALIDLYADDAKIRVSGVYPDGQVRELTMTGENLKAVLPRLLQAAKFRRDRSEYSDIVAEDLGTAVRIKAKRHSLLKNYVDNGYYMVISEQPDGSLAISEEHTEARPQTLPGGGQTGDDLSSRLRLLESRMEGLLPLMVDEDTRLDSVAVRGDVCIFSYTLVGVRREDLDADVFSALVRESLLEQACSEPGMSRAMEAGGSISFVYDDIGGERVAEVSVSASDCLSQPDPGSPLPLSPQSVDSVED